MADTVTPKLGMTKPEIGASNNTWGTKVNTNFDILDSKVISNTIQWSETLGDGNSASTAGPFLVTRYGNDGLRIDDPLSINRQTGEVGIFKSLLASVHRFIFQPVAPAAPPSGSINFFVDSLGNPVVQRPDGSVVYLGIPPGTIAWTGGPTADNGWALCDGSSVARATYPVLFSRFGTTFGSVDGATFNLPDLKGRVIAAPDGGSNRLITAFNGANVGNVGGADFHVLNLDQIPTHIHHYSGTGETLVDGPDHNHGMTGMVTSGGGPAGITTAGVAAQTSVTNPVTSGASARHTHTFNWSGDTESGTGLGGHWHPNAQPTIILNAQVKLG